MKSEKNPIHILWDRSASHLPSSRAAAHPPAWRKQRGSLKGRLVLLVLSCWLLPLLLIGGGMGGYLAAQMKNQAWNTILSMSESGARLAAIQLEEAVMASQAASYDRVLEKAYQEYQVYGNRARYYEQVYSYLMQKYRYDSKFDLSLYFSLKDPQELYHMDNGIAPVTHGLEEYRQSAHAEIVKLSGSLGTRIGFYSTGSHAYLVRNLVLPDYTPYAMLVLELSNAQIFSSLTGTEWSTGITVWLNGAQVVLKGDPVPLSLEDLPAASESLPYPKTGREYSVGGITLENCSIQYALEVDSLYLSGALKNMRWLVAGLVAFSIPLLFYVTHFFRRYINQPLGEFEKAYQSLERGELGIHMDTAFPAREFQYFKEMFNQMSAKLKAQFDKIYAEEIALRDARIMALQSQINPHFLNNTLEIINWEARLSGADKASRMIEALSVMLDAAMDRKAKPLIPLSQELTYADAYFYILSERLGKRLEVVRDLDPSLMECRIPRLVLQPILENAIEHSIDLAERGTLWLRSFRQGDTLILDVENDCLLSKEDEKKIALLLGDASGSPDSSYSLGIRNIHQRLQILYGPEAGLSIFMNENKHTVSRIQIPYGKTLADGQ